MNPPITSFVLINKYGKNDMGNKKYYYQRSETGQIEQKRVFFLLFQYIYIFNLIFYLVEKKGKIFILIPPIIKKTISRVLDALNGIYASKTFGKYFQ